MKLSGYIACICEGGAERAIMDLLLDSDKVIFSRDRMLEEGTIRCRDAKSFERKYLRKSYTEKITVVRILDSRRENFKLSRAYADKIEVLNIITAPEIEMLVILNEGKYAEFKKSGRKPSEYCKTKLKYKDVKEYEFVKEYFKNTDTLISAICAYRRMSKIQHGEYTLYDLLK